MALTKETPAFSKLPCPTCELLVSPVIHNGARCYPRHKERRVRMGKRGAEIYAAATSCASSLEEITDAS